MRYLYLIFLLFVIHVKAFAQYDEFGISSQINVNNFSSTSTPIINKGTALTNALVIKNKSVAIGLFARNDNYLFAVNFDVSSFSDNFMVDDDKLVVDNYFNKNQFVFKIRDDNSKTEKADIGANFIFNIKIIGNNKAKLFFANSIGVKNVSDRTTNLVLKESGSNNYYLAYYKFKVSPLYSYSPSIELEFFPFDLPTSFFMNAGVFFQYFTSSTSVDIINVNQLNINSPVNELKYYQTYSAKGMLNIGFRKSLW